MRPAVPALVPATLALTLGLASMVTAPSVASAEDVGGLEDAPLVRQQLLLRGERHELSVALGMSMNDAFVRGWAPTLGYTYYLTNWLGVGADININACAFGVDCRTDLADRIESIEEDQRASGLDDISVLSTLVSPYATLVPISGKLGILGTTVINWDVHLIMGGSLVLSDNAGDGKAIEAGSTLAPMLGIGQRFFIDDSMAITVSLRDYIVNRELSATEAGDDGDGPEVQKEIENRFFFNVGVSFFFPTAVQTAR